MARRIPVQIAFSEEVLTTLDKTRGATSRSSYVRRLVERHLQRKAKRQTFKEAATNE